MISTSFSSTSDYCSGSDPDYDDDHVVKAAPQHHHHPSKQTNIILKTLLRHHHHSSSHLSSSIRLQQSLTLLKVTITLFSFFHYSLSFLYIDRLQKRMVFLTKSSSKQMPFCTSFFSRLLSPISISRLSLLVYHLQQNSHNIPATLQSQYSTPMRCL